MTTVLDELATAGGQAFLGFVRQFKVNNKANLKDFNKTMNLLNQDLEENDRTIKHAAVRTQREAMSAQLAASQKAEADMREEMKAMRAEVQALRLAASAGKTALAARTDTRTQTQCPACKGYHRGPCIGEAYAEV